MQSLPDLILLNPTMPGIDGLDVLQQIKNNNRLNNIKIIGLSTAVLNKERKHEYEIDCDDFILKPVKV